MTTNAKPSCSKLLCYDAILYGNACTGSFDASQQRDFIIMQIPATSADSGRIFSVLLMNSCMVWTYEASPTSLAAFRSNLVISFHLILNTLSSIFVSSKPAECSNSFLLSRIRLMYKLSFADMLFSKRHKASLHNSVMSILSTSLFTIMSFSVSDNLSFKTDVWWAYKYEEKPCSSEYLSKILCKTILPPFK